MRNIDDQLMKKQDAKANERWVGVRPSAKQCKRCINALKDTQYTIGAEKAYCDMFVSPEEKTPGILTDVIECPYFEEK